MARQHHEAERRVELASARTRRHVAKRLALCVGLVAGVASADVSAPALECRPPEAVSAALPPPPQQLFGDLFVAVQTAQLYDDQKVFPDAVPLFEPEQILEDYARESARAGFDLRAFVEAHFTLPVDQGVSPPEGQSLRDHINWLWPALTRSTTSAPAYSSLIPLPEPYVVPGGRFREVYYWDSYFTMLGLAEAGEGELVLDMLRNFAYEIDSFGHIPNGNRTYYLSRSQPPFFSHMVELGAELEGEQLYATYLPQMQREYAYWMAGSEHIEPGGARDHVVVLPDGTRLNRFWDARDTPRDESYSQDVQTAAEAAGRPANAVFRDLRAAAESGIDFSSRWLGDGRTLATIRTTSIIPVDLNALLFHLETSIAHGCRVTGDRRCVVAFGKHAAARAAAIERYLFDEVGGYYSDYDFERGEARHDITPAAFYPLFVGVAGVERARLTAENVSAALLQSGGLAASTLATGQQWDAPNGWAPHQWVAIAGLERYGQDELAGEIGERFLASIEAVYAADGKLVEKYDVGAGSGSLGGGGEYPLQDGFGWSNALALLLLDRHRSAESGAESAADTAPEMATDAAAE